jgi:D-glycero-D-manno-heptose 1,7-bisphosphate phosphatase
VVKKIRKAVFLDRDGVLNIPIIKNKKSFAPLKLKDFRLYPNVEHFCKILKKDFLLIVITNQPDFLKKKISLNILKEMNNLLKKKINYDDLFYSLSGNPKNLYRKPNIGMFLKAKKKFSIDVKKSYLIGDRFTDIELARKVRCRSIFIDRRYNEKQPVSQIFTAKSFTQAVKFIIKNNKNS